MLNSINGMFVDKNNNVYLSDYGNRRILKWVPGASEAVLVAGGNGVGSATNQISLPTGLYVDSDLNLFVLDEGNYRITKWAPGATEGVVVVQASNGSGNSNLISPQGFTMDKNGVFYIADTVNNRILRWESGASEGTVVAGGNGKGSALNQIYFPNDSHIDDNGDIYIADVYNGRVVKWMPEATEGIVVATGLGSYNFAKYGDLIFAAANDQILKWELGNTQGTVVSGTGTGSGDNQYNGIWWIRKNDSGDIFVMDNGNERVQKVSLVNQIEIEAGSKTGTFTVTAIDDTLYDEGDETIIVTPSDITNATLASTDPTTLTITNVNYPPLAYNISASTPINTNATISLIGGDQDFDSLTYSIVSNPSSGTATLNGDVVTYTPTTDYIGNDTFTFKVNDGGTDSEIKTVSIKVFQGWLSEKNKHLDIATKKHRLDWKCSYTSNFVVKTYKNVDETFSQVGDSIVIVDQQGVGDWGSARTVSLNYDGTIFAIGIPTDDTEGQNYGRTRVYQLINGAWTEMGSGIGRGSDSQKPESVSLSNDGKTVAIGQYQQGNSFKGDTRIYNWDGSDWIKLGESIIGEVSTDFSGCSVSLSSNGRIVAIGARLNNGDFDYSENIGAGTVRIYEFKENTGWTKLGENINGEGENDRFGSSVSLNSKGNRVAVGAHLNNNDNGEYAGHVRVYGYSSDWSQLGWDLDGEAAADLFGVSL